MMPQFTGCPNYTLCTCFPDLTHYNKFPIIYRVSQLEIIHAKGCPIFRKLVSVNIITIYDTEDLHSLHFTGGAKPSNFVTWIYTFLLNDPVVNRYECSLLKKPSNLPSLELISSNLPSLELLSSNLPSLKLFSSNLPSFNCFLRTFLV